MLILSKLERKVLVLAALHHARVIEKMAERGEKHGRMAPAIFQGLFKESREIRRVALEVNEETEIRIA